MRACARIQDFLSGWSMPDAKNGLNNVFFRFFSFKSLTYFTEDLLQRKLYFFQVSKGVQHLPGGGGVQLFPVRGVQMLISIETHIT